MNKENNEEIIKKIKFFMYVVITESRNLHIWGTNIDIISKIPTEDYDIIRSYLKSIGYKEFRNYIYVLLL